MLRVMFMLKPGIRLLLRRMIRLRLRLRLSLGSSSAHHRLRIALA